MSGWNRPGLPGGHLSIAELHHISLVSDSRVQYKHSPDADMMERVRIIPDLESDSQAA